MELESAYGYNSIGDLVWWPLFALCVIGALDRWIDAQKAGLQESIGPIARIGYSALAVAAPAFGLYVLFLSGKKYGWSHVGVALFAMLIGSIAFSLMKLIIATIVVAIIPMKPESRSRVLHWFKRFPASGQALVLLPVVVYALLMMYYRGR